MRGPGAFSFSIYMLLKLFTPWASPRPRAAARAGDRVSCAPTDQGATPHMLVNNYSLTAVLLRAAFPTIDVVQLVCGNEKNRTEKCRPAGVPLWIALRRSWWRRRCFRSPRPAHQCADAVFPPVSLPPKSIPIVAGIEANALLGGVCATGVLGGRHASSRQTISARIRALAVESAVPMACATATPTSPALAVRNWTLLPFVLAHMRVQAMEGVIWRVARAHAMLGSSATTVGAPLPSHRPPSSPSRCARAHALATAGASPTVRARATTVSWAMRAIS